MAFLAYFAALSTMGAVVFGLSMLLEPSPVVPGAKQLVEQRAVPPAQPKVAAKLPEPQDETVTEPPAVFTADKRPPEDAESAPDAPAIAAAPDATNAVSAASRTEPTARSAMASAATAEADVDEADDTASVAMDEPEQRAVQATPRKRAVRPARAERAGQIRDLNGRTVRYVGMRNGLPTYVVE